MSPPADLGTRNPRARVLGEPGRSKCSQAAGGGIRVPRSAGGLGIPTGGGRGFRDPRSKILADLFSESRIPKRGRAMPRFRQSKPPADLGSGNPCLPPGFRAERVPNIRMAGSAPSHTCTKTRASTVRSSRRSSSRLSRRVGRSCRSSRGSRGRRCSRSE